MREIQLREAKATLSAVIDRFVYLKQALALVLVFIGSKLFIGDLLGWDKFPPAISLAVTLGLIGGGVVYSLYRTKGQPLVQDTDTPHRRWLRATGKWQRL